MNSDTAAILDSLTPELAGLSGVASETLVKLTDALKGLCEAVKQTITPLAFLQEAIKPNLSLLAAFGEAIKPSLSVLSMLSAGMGSAANEFANLNHKLSRLVLRAPEPPPLATATEKASAAIQVRKEDTGAVTSPLASVGRALASLGTGLSKSAAALGSFTVGLQTANQAMMTIGDSFKSLHHALLGRLEGLVSAVSPFVQALNPNLMFGLNYAMRSLYATVGTALTPVVQVLTGAVRQFAGILTPAMRAIAPALGSLTSAVMSLFTPTVHLVADVLKTLAPLFEQLAGVAHTLVGAWAGVRALLVATFQSLATWLKGLFGAGDFGGVLKRFRDGLHTAIESLLKFTVMLARAFGFHDFLPNLVKSLRHLGGAEKPAVGVPPAPTDVGFKTFEDISKTMAAAAFAAQGKGGLDNADAKSEREWLAELAKSLEDIKGEFDLKEFVRNIGDTIVKALDRAGEKTKGKIAEWTEVALVPIRNTVDAYSTRLRNWYYNNVTVAYIAPIMTFITHLKNWLNIS